MNRAMREGGSDASRCCHLQECMFPRYLSLDCKRMDDFSMGCVKEAPNMTCLGRVYIEALHLKGFLKSPEAITSKGSGKRGRKNSDSPSRKKNRSSLSRRKIDKSDEQLTDNVHLAQVYFGGLEGKRTCFLANSHQVGKGGGVAGSYCPVLENPATNVAGTEDDSNFLKTGLKKLKRGVPPSHESTDSLIASEVKLASLRKAIRLHDQTISLDSAEGSYSELTRLENLIKPLPGYKPPTTSPSDRGKASDTAAEYRTNIGSTISNEKPMALSSAVTTTPISSPDVEPKAGEVNVKGTEKSHRNESDEMIARKKMNSGVNVGISAVSGAKEKPWSSNDKVKKEGLFSIYSPARQQREVSSSNESHAKLGNAANQLHDHRKSNFDRAIYEGREASLAANMLLGSFRRNRRNFWAQKLKNGKAPECAWCPHSNRCPVNRNVNSEFEFGTINENDERGHCGPTGDALIQCMECDFVGCAPSFLAGKEGSSQHAMSHFLMSGHRFGVTCGPLGEIFCIRCGDIVHHECFDQERERVFLEHNIPSLCWRETSIIRGVDASSFIVTPENGVVWRGMIATYPAPVSDQLVEAARSAAKRFSLFHGNVRDRLVELGVKAGQLSIHKQCQPASRWIPKPVGMYNLGNTCYMNATLQCMINCKPLQELFLRDLVHPYQSCDALRFGSNNKASCLACAVDKVFAQYCGNAVGLDVIGKLEDQAEELSLDANTIYERKQADDNRGHPIIPASLLADIWKNRGMKQVTGYGQHDAQEFFNALVDCLATHAIAYEKSAQDMRQAVRETQIVQSQPNSSPSAKPNSDSIKKIFMGTLRSVLICQHCGCKRTQTEAFSNVSLPLTKEFLTPNPEARSSPRHGKISVRSMLNDFTRPESLSDPVFCPSCNSKTQTLKQHTFSKLPKVLCLHLKRFDATTNKKITDFVAFPAYGLDMGKHLPHWCERGLEVKERNDEEHGGGSPKVLYDLFATVNHKGTLHQGHYTANVKNENQWYSCNNAYITVAGEGDGEKEILSSEGAYMLFYIRR